MITINGIGIWRGEMRMMIGPTKFMYEDDNGSGWCEIIGKTGVEDIKELGMTREIAMNWDNWKKVL